MIRKLLPHLFKRTLRTAHRSIRTRRAMEKFTRNPLLAVEDEGCLQSLIYGWGNQGWSAESEYLKYIVRTIANLNGQEILECGSGLSTLLLAATASSTGSRVTSLENDRGWAGRVTAELKRYGLAEAVRLHVSPLREYDSFAWYSVPARMGPFSAVVCDGPPSSTRGGRFGLLPVMGERLAPGCRILLDDATREDERAILERWKSDFRIDYRVLGEKKPFAEAVTPESPH